MKVAIAASVNFQENKMMMHLRVICLSIAASISGLLLVGCGSPSADVASTPSPAAASTETAASATPTSDAATLKPALQKAIAQYLKANNVPADTEVKFFADFIDLNGDGLSDAVLVFDSSYWCGTGGCTMLVFEGQKDSAFKLVSESSLVNPPITVSDSKTKGWRDLVLTVSGGGMPAKTIALKFDGQKYPLNPSDQTPLPANATPKGAILFPVGTQAEIFKKSAS